MRQRLILAVGTLTVFLIVAVVGALVSTPRHRVDRNYNRVAVGMSVGQVEALLGDPATEDDAKQNPTLAAYDTFLQRLWPRRGTLWIGEEWAVWVRFDETGKVAGGFPLRFRPGSQGLLDFLRRLLGW